MLACKLVCCMNFYVTLCTQCRLVGATNHTRRSFLTHITLDLHLTVFFLERERERDYYQDLGDTQIEEYDKTATITIRMVRFQENLLGKCNPERMRAFLSV